ncbi:MAG TPA: alcohol dehydrogenase catalytic domain-containing protein [Bryobacteraceae bacterium]|nr:alcohol dehydrogenase catalytic domain-containing protein [Bryobacteraceae bacterium]
MKSVQLVAPRTLEVREVPSPPEPGPSEVLVRPKAVGVCGSDLHWYREGRIGWTPAAYPQVLGHEPVAEVAAAGKGAGGFHPGQRVTIEPAIVCGRCEFCLDGQPNNCVRSRFMGGPDQPGLFRELAAVPAGNVVPIPDSLSLVQAALIEPLAVILHLMELTPIRVGDTVAVLGCGSIGMLCASVARLRGASWVIAADKVEHRLPLAKRMGADVTVLMPRESLRDAVMDHTRGRGVDVVLDAAGATETINAGIGIARRAGVFTLVGLPDEMQLDVDLHTAMAKELRLQMMRRSCHNSHRAIDLLAAGRIPDALVTHRPGLEQTPAAFAMLDEYAGGVGKVVVEIP